MLKIFSVKTNASEFHIDISDLPSGFYLLKVSDGIGLHVCELVKD
ncbi:MAG: T9SS type A sorting domain-containing protein [Chitinophagaceae bacterium]|nr:T9SS type A sorting domain-containing protein [Chitinophagaceae bacterium]